MAVRSPTREERVVARGADLVGVDGRALVALLGQDSRQCCKQSGGKTEVLHHESSVLGEVMKSMEMVTYRTRDRKALYVAGDPIAWPSENTIVPD